MPTVTVEELQQQLDKSEEEKAEAIKRAEAAEEELEKNQEGTDPGSFKKPKGGKKPNDENDEGQVRKDEKKRRKAQKRADEAAEELEKADLSPAARKILEKAESDNRELVTRLEKAEKDNEAVAAIAKDERDKRIVKECIAKAEEDYGALAIDATEFGPVMKAMDEKLTKEEREAIDTVLKSANEIVRKSALFEELGKGGSPVAGDALAKLQHKAEEIRKSDSSLSAEEALQKAMETDPELQAQYLAEVR